MPMVSITYNKVLSDVWSHPELVLAVGGESDERFVKYCRSWERLTIMQVLIPIFALNSAAVARKSLLDTLYRHGAGRRASTDADARIVGSSTMNIRGLSQELPLEAMNTKVQPWPISAVVCAIEAPTLLLLGAVLALGQNGPMLLPHIVDLICSDLFLGISLLTSLLVALYLQDEAPKDNGNDAQPPPSSTWSKHRRKLMAAAIFLTLTAAAPLGNILVPMYWDYFGGLLFAIVYAPLTIGCSVYFLYKAWLFRQHIVFFICQLDALAEQFGPLAQRFRLVGCLAFWLFVSAICMLMNASILVSVAVTMLGFGKSGVVRPLINLEHFLVLDSLMGVSRIGISIAQVFAISHHSVVEEGLFGRNCFTCYVCREYDDASSSNMMAKRQKKTCVLEVGNMSESSGSIQEWHRQRPKRLSRVHDKNRITPTDGVHEESLPRPSHTHRKSSERRYALKISCKYGEKRRRRQAQNKTYPEPASPLDIKNHFSDTVDARSQDTENVGGDGLRPSPAQQSMLLHETLNVGWCDLHGDYAFALELSEREIEGAYQLRIREMSTGTEIYINDDCCCR